MSRRDGGAAWCGVAWAVLFLLVMLHQPLPNNGQILRKELLPFLPFALLDVIDPPQTETSLPRGLAYLPERLPLWGTAAVVVLAAWALGSWLLSRLPALRLSAGEFRYFSVLVGFGVLALLTLGLGYLGLLSSWLFWLILLGVTGLAVWQRPERRQVVQEPELAAWDVRAVRWWLLAMSPFVVGMALGSLSPSTDFDVIAYHLGGPKEWFLAGRIEFLPHNVYTSFPFLTEMLLLDGMLLLGDWFWGGLAGQAVLMTFAPLTAWGIALAGRRWFSPTAGLAGALIYLSTPWVFRMSIIAYAEGGLTAFVFGTAYALFLALDHCAEPRPADTTATPAPAGAVTGRLILVGLCAGGAMACKYTGLVTAVLPAAVVLGVDTLRKLRRSATPRPVWMFGRDAAAFSLGVAVMIGPWLLKNLVETGNPVYPLGYAVFGGRDLDDDLADKWKRGHARPQAGSAWGELRDLGAKAFDVAAVNDWQSPLIFMLAPLACLWTGPRKLVWGWWAVTIWQFLSWWLFTHHLDRFWIPLLPSAAALAGVAVVSVAAVWPRRIIHAAFAAGLLFNLGFVSTSLVGYNAGLTRLPSAAEFAVRVVSPEIALLNAALEAGELPPDAKILCVGEAALFHARFPYVYNTVFDHSIFETWCGEPGPMASGERPLRSTADIRKKLADEGITHLLVSWADVLRYRQPANYGFTDFVHPQRFRELVDRGVLAAPLALPQGFGRLELSDPEPGIAQQARQWAPELIAPCGERECLTTSQLFPVVRQSPTADQDRSR